MKEWDEVLRDLADDPSEFERDGGTVILRRHGTEHTLELRMLAGLGCTALDTDGTREPVEVFVQRRLLRLDHLAGQMLRTFQRLQEKRPVPFVDGPVDVSTGARSPQRRESAAQALGDLLSSPEYGTTHVVQLMANAGQGKTVLLEHVAMEAALRYQPNANPNPLILPVDLLGRYVGNVDDAIAGSLNNTFASPGLRQADVLVCLRKNWMILALDGFDELVARVGVANAFAHITDLVDQLNGYGTVVLSARASFFELYEISSGIRRFLVPKRGTYSSSVVKLAGWTETQGFDVFRAIGSEKPEADLTSLLELFHEDRDVVFHPFFLTRLATLWKGGERFEQLPGQTDALARAKWVIETFVERENRDKWTSTSGTPLLAREQHIQLLGGVAEEMWHTGAFRLRPDELRLAAEIGIMDLNLDREVLDQVKERAPTHAAFIESGGYVSFFHDQFLSYALGHRVAYYLRTGKEDSLARLLLPRTLPPDATKWTAWSFKQFGGIADDAAATANRFAAKGFGSMAQAESIGRLLAEILAGETGPHELVKQRFFGDSLKDRTYHNLTLRSCSFWEADLRGTGLLNCAAYECEFGGVIIDKTTLLSGSKLSTCRFSGLQVEEGGSAYSPLEIERILRQRGAMLEMPRTNAISVTKRAAEAAITVVEEIIRRSERTCDVALEDLEQDFLLAPKILRAAEKTGVMKRIQRPTSGPKKAFYRFQVDRNQILRGQGAIVNDESIDGFWRELAAKFPV
jgi:hypothetical protein